MKHETNQEGGERMEMRCGIYRRSYTCANGGVSDLPYKDCILIWDDPEAEPGMRDKTPIVVLSAIGSHRIAVAAPPVHMKHITDRVCGPMAGGAFIYCCDSRFPSEYPIPLHDRYETQEEYDMLSQ